MVVNNYCLLDNNFDTRALLILHLFSLHHDSQISLILYFQSLLMALQLFSLIAIADLYDINTNQVLIPLIKSRILFDIGFHIMGHFFINIIILTPQVHHRLCPFILVLIKMLSIQI
jgi:hypothetical protein